MFYNNVKKRFPLIIVILFIIITRFYIYNITQSFYFVDCYDYITKAINYSRYNIISLSRGFPVIFIFGFLYKLLYFINIDIYFKLIMIIINIIMSIMLFKLTNILFDKQFKSILFIFVVFTEPYFIFYSLQPYLEYLNYFFIFLFIYLLVKNYPSFNLKYFILILPLFFITVFIRYEVLFIFIPAIIFYFLTIYNINKKIYIKFLYYYLLL